MKFAQPKALIVLFILLPIIRCQTTDDDSCDDDSTYVQESIQTILANLSNEVGNIELLNGSQKSQAQLTADDFGFDDTSGDNRNVLIGIEVNGQEVSINPIRDPGPFYYKVDILGLRFALTATNNVFRGFADAKVSNTQVENDGPNTVIHFETSIPYLTHTTDYTMTGTVQSLMPLVTTSLNEKGTAVFTYNNTEIKHEITLEEVCQNGTEVWRVKSYRAKFHSDEITANYGNLFGGRNAFLANALSALIDKYVMKMVEQARSEIDLAYSKVFGKMARLLLNGHPTGQSCTGEEQ